MMMNIKNLTWVAVRVKDWGVLIAFELLAFGLDEDEVLPFVDTLLFAVPLLLFKPGLDLNRDKIS